MQRLEAYLSNAKWKAYFDNGEMSSMWEETGWAVVDENGMDIAKCGQRDNSEWIARLIAELPRTLETLADVRQSLCRLAYPLEESDRREAARLAEKIDALFNDTNTR